MTTNFEDTRVPVGFFCQPWNVKLILIFKFKVQSLSDLYWVATIKPTLCITWGSKATNLGGEFLRGINRHMGTTSLAIHLPRSAENNVVLPDTLCGAKWKYWMTLSSTTIFNVNCIAFEIKRLWRLCKARTAPIVIGALGNFYNNLRKYPENLHID